MARFALIERPLLHLFQIIPELGELHLLKDQYLLVAAMGTRDMISEPGLADFSVKERIIQ
jgi:hypothetical protein